MYTAEDITKYIFRITGTSLNSVIYIWKNQKFRRKSEFVFQIS